MKTNENFVRLDYELFSIMIPQNSVTKMSFRDIPAGKILFLDEYLKTKNKDEKEIRIFVDEPEKMTILSTAKIQVVQIELNNFKINEGFAKTIFMKKGIIATSFHNGKPSLLFDPLSLDLNGDYND